MRVIVLIIVLLTIIFSSTTFSLKNPAAVYCSELGYEYIIEKTPEGDKGYCILPNGEKIDEWDFLRGKRGIEYGYCKKIGLEAKSVKNLSFCKILDECTVCVFPNGTEIEVTNLMNLSFEETICGDRVCGFPETHETCPIDCPSGFFDLLCDGITDGICDPDCILFNNTKKDPDCVDKSSTKKYICLNIKDGICEEDCEEDPDCIIEGSRVPIAPLLLSFVIILSAFLFFYFYRRAKYIKRL